MPAFTSSISSRFAVAASLVVAAGCASTDAKPAPAAVAPDAPYRVVKTLKIGGEGRWDLFAIDSGTQRLYVPRSDHVLVVDAKTGAVLGTLPDTKGVHGVALIPELSRGFSSDGAAGTITDFNLDRLFVNETFSVGKNPDAIFYDAASHSVWCGNAKSHDVSIITMHAGGGTMLMGPVDVGGAPELFASDGAGQVFLNLEDTSEVLRFDAESRKITARWPLAPGKEPTGIAMDAKNHRLFIGCHNKMMIVLDSETGRVLATPPIGEGVDGAGFDPATGTAFASCGDGTLTAVRETSSGAFDVVQTIATAKGARTMVLDPTTHLIYLPTAEFGEAPAPTPEQPRPRPAMIPGTFQILVVGR